MNKESFLIYKSFYEPIKFFNDEQLGRLFRAIFEYQISQNENVDNDIRIAFEFFKNQFRLDNLKYEKICERNKKNGLKGGRPKKNEENPKNPMDIIKPKKADNDNDNDNVNEKDNDNNIYSPASPAKAEQNIPYKEIIDYLNFKLQSNYKDTTRKTRDLIKARYNENFKLDDFKKVIDNKCEEWLNTEMQKYLRPETLFGTKFESYLNQQNKSKYKDYMPDWFDKNVETKETSNQDIKELEELLKDFN